MAFSSGTFSLVSGNPVVSGSVISSTTHNNTMSDIADNGLTMCLLKDGTQTVTANIPMANFKFTGLGAGTAAGDSARIGNVQNSTGTLISSVAGTNTITGACSPALTAYASGQQFVFVPANTNTGATTLNIDSLGAKNINAYNGACVGGEIIQSVPIEVAYDGSAFNILGNQNRATQAQQQTGTSITTMVTPGRQHFHRSAAKAWIKCNASGTISGSFGVASITDLAQGQVRVTWSTAFASSASQASCVTGEIAGNAISFAVIVASTTFSDYSSIDFAATASSKDPTFWHVMAFGDQ